MLDIKLFREQPEIIKNDLEKRNLTEKVQLVEKIISLDKQWRDLQQETQDLRHLRNTISIEIGQLKKHGKEKDVEKEVKAKLKQAEEIPNKIKKVEEKQRAVRKHIDGLLYQLPNILHHSVPRGASEADNVVVETINPKPSFSFPLKDHITLMESLNLVDLERAAKIAGARFYALKGQLVLLDIALQQYALHFMQRKGFTAMLPPFMMNRTAYSGVVDLHDFEDVMYKIDNEDLYLIATSEHPLTAQYKDEQLDEKQLPIKLVGVSPCFRKEAGAHGKDTKGIFRVHQFNKVEQIVLCKPEDSWAFHEELLNNAKELFKQLGLHFRVVNLCTADIGSIAAKKYDLEVWMPAQNTYREVVSCSNCTDYQSRRLQIRYRTNEGNKLVHTLNSTAIATTRVLVAILENYQNKDGSVTIPKTLIPFMGGLKKIEA